MRIFHLATLADWEAAQTSGRYTTSTRGRTLAEEGFIHAARADQWQGVRERYYVDVTEPLVLLVIDTDRLDAPVVEEEAVPGSGETFPHVYGAIAPDAVVQVLPVDGAGGRTPAGSPSFSTLFLGELVHQVVLASVVLGPAVLGTAVGIVVDDTWGPLVGAVSGIVLGVVAAVVVHRRRRARLA